MADGRRITVGLHVHLALWVALGPSPRGDTTLTMFISGSPVSGVPLPEGTTSCCGSTSFTKARNRPYIR